MSLKIETHKPSHLIPPSLSSANLHVVRKRRTEILPQNSNVDFQYSGNNRIIFNISSANEMVVVQDTYFRCEFRSYGEGSAGVRDRFLSLGTGGINACIKRATLRLANGMEIERIDDCNKFYAVMSTATASRSHIELAEVSSGDSVSDKPMWDTDNCDVARAGVYNATGSNVRYSAYYDDSDAAVLQDLFSVGIVPEGAVLQDDTANEADNTLQLKFANTGLKEPTRMAVCLNDSAQTAALGVQGVVLTMKLPFSLFKQHQVIPVNYIQSGLQIELELEDPIFALTNSRGYGDVNPTADSSSVYKFLNPRIVACMVQPSEEIQEMYLQLYKQNMLTYPYQYARHFFSTDDGASAGIKSFSYNPNRRSLRTIVSVVQDVNHNVSQRTASDAANAAVQDCIGTFIDGAVNSYQYKIGSDLYPDLKIEIDDTNCSEAHTELMKTFGQHGSVLFEPRYKPYELRKENTVSGVANQSKKLIMSYDFSRDNSIFSGVDASIAPLTAEFNTSAVYAPGTRYYHSWVLSDTVLQIGRDGISYVG